MSSGMEVDVDVELGAAAAGAGDEVLATAAGLSSLLHAATTTTASAISVRAIRRTPTIKVTLATCGGPDFCYASHVDFESYDRKTAEAVLGGGTGMTGLPDYLGIKTVD